jgi:hypothetical protein
MGAKKWSKWVVGLSSVISFAGFLYATQDHQSESPDSDIRMEPYLPLSQTAVSTTGGESFRTFIHSRAEFQQIMQLSPEERSLREAQLEDLEWDRHAPVNPPSKIRSDRRTRRS